MVYPHFLFFLFRWRLLLKLVVVVQLWPGAAPLSMILLSPSPETVGDLQRWSSPELHWFKLALCIALHQNLTFWPSRFLSLSLWGCQLSRSLRPSRGVPTLTPKVHPTESLRTLLPSSTPDERGPPKTRPNRSRSRTDMRVLDAGASQSPNRARDLRISSLLSLSPFVNDLHLASRRSRLLFLTFCTPSPPIVPH